MRHRGVTRCPEPHRPSGQRTATHPRHGPRPEAPVPGQAVGAQDSVAAQRGHRRGRRPRRRQGPNGRRPSRPISALVSATAAVLWLSRPAADPATVTTGSSHQSPRIPQVPPRGGRAHPAPTITTTPLPTTCQSHARGALFFAGAGDFHLTLSYTRPSHRGCVGHDSATATRQARASLRSDGRVREWTNGPQVHGRNSPALATRRAGPGRLPMLARIRRGLEPVGWFSYAALSLARKEAGRCPGLGRDEPVWPARQSASATLFAPGADRGAFLSGSSLPCPAGRSRRALARSADLRRALADRAREREDEGEGGREGERERERE